LVFRGLIPKAFVPHFNVKAIDTDAAGDTFIGFFLAAHQSDFTICRCIKNALCRIRISGNRKRRSAFNTKLKKSHIWKRNSAVFAN